MKFTKIKIDITCSKCSTTDPSYRLYLDNVLVIERVFWPEAPIYKIQEHLTLVNDNSTHYIKLENVFTHLGKIIIDKVVFVDGDDEEILDIFNTFSPGDEEFSFKLRIDKY